MIGLYIDLPQVTQLMMADLGFKLRNFKFRGGTPTIALCMMKIQCYNISMCCGNTEEGAITSTANLRWG